MKRLRKLCLSFFALLIGLMGAYSHANNMTVLLRPGWNVFSTPAILSSISFSNGGDGISFSKLENGQWISITANTGELVPLEGFLVENTNNTDVEVTLTFEDNVSPANALLQKNLSLGWNFLGITTNVNPFNNIVGNVNMTIDFTYGEDGNAQSNFLNKVNPNYAGNQNSNIITAPQYGEAYGAFITSNNAIYGGINNKNADNGIIDPNGFGCTIEELMACVVADDIEECLDTCRNRGVDITIGNLVATNQTSAPGTDDVVLLDLKVMSQKDYDIQEFELNANPDIDFNQFEDGKVTLYIDGNAYEITGTTTTFSSSDSFSININDYATIRVVGNILDENEFTGDYTSSIFEFKIKKVEDVELNKEIGGLSIKGSGHTTNIFGINLTIQSIQGLTANYIEEGKETDVLSFSIKPNDQQIQLKEIKMTIDADDVNDLSTINNVELHKSDGTIISRVESESFVINGTTAEIIFYAINHYINANTTESYYITATLNNGTSINLGKPLTFILEDIKYKPTTISEDVRASSHGYTNLIEKTYIITTDIPTFSIEKNNENILVTINNQSAYDIEINSFKIKIGIIANEMVTWNTDTWRVLDAIGGTVIATPAAQDIPGTININNFTAGYETIAANSSATFVIEMDSAVNILSDYYFVRTKGISFYYDDNGIQSNLIEATY